MCNTVFSFLKERGALAPSTSNASSMILRSSHMVSSSYFRNLATGDSMNSKALPQNGLNHEDLEKNHSEGPP